MNIESSINWFNHPIINNDLNYDNTTEKEYRPKRVIKI